MMRTSIDIRDLVSIDASSFHVHRANLLTAGHGQDARNAIRYVYAAHVDEPLFVIRGRDVLAVPALLGYQDQCSKHGLYEMTNQVANHRVRFTEWQAANPGHLKFPDPWVTISEATCASTTDTANAEPNPNRY